MNEAEFKTLKALSVKSNITQRDLSKKVGLSLGSINYILKEFIKKGYVKTQRFKNSNNKTAYIYILTPHGINIRIQQAQIFLEQKIREYEKLKHEIEELKKESILFPDETKSQSK